jgi:hypothetical protein
VPDVPAKAEADGGVPVMPGTPEAPSALRLGFPKRSTPSLAADMMAEPSMEASNREGIDPAALSPSPCETDPVVVAAGAWRAMRIGLLCWRLDA